MVVSWKIWEEMAQASRNRKSMYCFFISVNLILNFFELFELEILEFFVSLVTTEDEVYA